MEVSNISKIWQEGDSLKFQYNSTFEEINTKGLEHGPVWPLTGHATNVTSTSVTLPLIWAIVLFLVIDLSHAGRRLSRRRIFPPGPRSISGFFWGWRKIIWSNDVSLMPGVRPGSKDFDDRIIGGTNILQKKGGVIISDYGMLREAFRNPDIIDRPPNYFLQMFPDSDNKGVVLGSGSSWRELRQFLVSQLKSFGVGHKTLGPVIANEAFEIVASLRKNINKPFSSHNFFNVPVYNVLWNLISSQKLKAGDPRVKNLVHVMEKLAPAWLLALILSNYHFGRLLNRFLTWLGRNPFFDYNHHFRAFTSKVIEERRVDPEFQMGRDNDFLDTFLHRIEETTEPTSPFYGQQGYENLREVIRDFFVAGTETTGSTMSWALLYLALHPDKQEKLQKEIDTVLEGRTPTLHDRNEMKYTTAVINETLRKSTNLPFALPHKASQDTRIGKFFVPKDTLVLGNLYAIHHCEKTWGDPFVFRPERFLGEDVNGNGPILVKYDQFIPFGTGKRMCPGASLAQDQLFMLITIIFREFNVTWNPAEPKPGMGAKLGFAIAPLAHTLIITERKQRTSNTN